MPAAGVKDRLGTADEELIEAYRGKISLPFVAGENRQAAIKIADHCGIESIKLIRLP